MLAFIGFCGQYLATGKVGNFLPVRKQDSFMIAGKLHGSAMEGVQSTQD